MQEQEPRVVMEVEGVKIYDPAPGQVDFSNLFMNVTHPVDLSFTLEGLDLDAAAKNFEKNFPNINGTGKLFLNDPFGKGPSKRVNNLNNRERTSPNEKYDFSLKDFSLKEPFPHPVPSPLKNFPKRGWRNNYNNNGTNGNNEHYLHQRKYKLQNKVNHLNNLLKETHVALQNIAGHSGQRPISSQSEAAVNPCLCKCPQCVQFQNQNNWNLNVSCTNCCYCDIAKR